MNILVTGALGFIGAHLCERLLEEGHVVYGVDLEDYDDYKAGRLQSLRKHKKFVMIFHDLSVSVPMSYWWTDGLKKHDEGFDIVYHLAASTGVQDSKVYPQRYFQNNVVAFQNVLMQCHFHKVPLLVYASSSSVYGEQEYEMSEMETSTGDQVSYYAGTKRAGEALAKSMANHFSNTKMICCRFFTVYGPYGRKDMAPYIFAEKIMKGEEIELRDLDEDGTELDLARDFTYVDDIVGGLLKVAGSKGRAKHRTFNLGSSNPILIREFIAVLADLLGKEANVKHVRLPEGDVPMTCASMTKYMLEVDLHGLDTDPMEGVKKFVEWFREYRKDLFTV